MHTCKCKRKMEEQSFSSSTMVGAESNGQRLQDTNGLRCHCRFALLALLALAAAIFQYMECTSLNEVLKLLIYASMSLVVCVGVVTKIACLRLVWFL